MIDESGFDNDSIDIFDCDTNHSMNSAHFLQWIERAAVSLQKKSGTSCRMYIIIDNATIHNKLTNSTQPPNRSWRKDQVQAWLREHNVDFNNDLKKSELLQLAFDNLPRKEYKVNLKAKMFVVEILKVPVKHYSIALNYHGERDIYFKFPYTKLYFRAQLKSDVHDNRTSFNLTDSTASSRKDDCA